MSQSTLGPTVNRLLIERMESPIGVDVGSNAIGAMLAEGWFCGFVGRRNQRDHGGKHPRLGCMLVMVHADGSRETFTPVNISQPTEGRYVIDQGQNFAGVMWFRLTDTTPRQRVEICHAERLYPDGIIYTTNLRGAISA